MIRRLGKEDRKLLDAFLHLSSTSKCIRILAEEALHCHAQNIKAGFKLNDLLIVEDDGDGYSKRQLENLLQTPNFVALQSVCSEIKIRSRQKTSLQTVEVSTNSPTHCLELLQHQGTVFILVNLFECLPVRKKRMLNENDRLEIERELLNLCFKEPKLHIQFFINGELSLEMPRAASLIEKVSIVLKLPLCNLEEIEIESNGLSFNIIALKNPTVQSWQERVVVYNEETCHLSQIPEIIKPHFPDIFKIVYCKISGQLPIAKLTRTKKKSKANLAKVQPTLDINVAGKSRVHHKIFSAGQSFIKVHQEPFLCFDLRSQDFRLIGNFNNEFIVISCAGQLVLVDQHAADERIRLESLLKQLGPDCDKIPVNLTRWKITANMQQLGFTAAAIPKVFAGISTESLHQGLREMRMVPLQVGTILLNHLKSVACHGAIRFGDLLSRSQMQSLLTFLLQCDYPGICAHGRPSVKSKRINL